MAKHMTHPDKVIRVHRVIGRKRRKIFFISVQFCYIIWLTRKKPGQLREGAGILPEGSCKPRAHAGEGY